MPTYRSLGSLLAGLITVCAFGQDATTAQALAVGDGYANLQANASDVLFSLSGTDTRNGGTQFRSDLTYSGGLSLAPQHVELLEYTAPMSVPLPAIPTRTIVGDGTTMWGYSGARNDYTALNYGVYSGANPVNYRDNFFHALTTAARSQSAGATRLLADIYDLGAAYDTVTPSGSPTFKPWIPGLQNLVSLDDPTLPPRPPVWPPSPIGGSGYADPVLPGLSYLPTATTQYQVVYEPTLQKSVAFELQLDATLNKWVLTDVYSAQNFRTGTEEWHLTISRMPTIAAGTFSFVPPRGSRAIVGKSGG